MRLENWSVVSYYEEEGGSIHGEVYGNPKFIDGHHVVTSMVEAIDPVKRTVTTHSGSVYELGKVDPEWEKIFPDAENRFWNNNPQLVGG